MTFFKNFNKTKKGIKHYCAGRRKEQRPANCMVLLLTGSPKISAWKQLAGTVSVRHSIDIVNTGFLLLLSIFCCVFTWRKSCWSQRLLLKKNAAFMYPNMCQDWVLGSQVVVWISDILFCPTRVASPFPVSINIYCTCSLNPVPSKLMSGFICLPMPVLWLLVLFFQFGAVLCNLSLWSFQL